MEVLNVIESDDSQVMREVLLSARRAFELFDRQNVLLESSFHFLGQDLERSSDELNRTSRDLTCKVHELEQVLIHLQSILESLTDGVLVVSRAGRIEFSNTAARRILGVKEADLQKHPRYEEVVTVPFQVKRLNHVLENAASDLYKEFELNYPLGGRMLLQSSMSPVMSWQDGMLGVVEIFRDVTQLRQLERQLKQQRHMAALGEMAAGIAHEIRNPLGAIEGFARLLKKDLEDASLDSFSKMASRIIEGTENLNYVVSNLLDYARPVHLEYQMFSVQPVICSLRDYLDGVLREQNVELIIQDPGPEMQLRGDVRQLRHVLINLGRNAVEACSAGGQVHIDFHLYQGEGAFHISDNGCGISPENLEKIFDPFYTTKHGGTGLGLSFCHKIVEAHGGEILAHSDGVSGTVFQVIIPQWRNVS
jgi:PAS domain S-box-containing protein